MSEEQKPREHVKSRELVPRDKQRTADQKQPREQRPRGASGGQNRKRSGKQQQRRKPQASVGSTDVQGEPRERTNQQKKRRQQKKSRNTKAPRKDVPAKPKDDAQQRKAPKDITKRDLDKVAEIKQARAETQSAGRDRRFEKQEASDRNLRGADRPRRERKKRLKRDFTFRAEETVEDIVRDIIRIEKDIQIDIDSIRNQKLDL